MVILVVSNHLGVGQCLWSALQSIRKFVACYHFGSLRSLQSTMEFAVPWSFCSHICHLSQVWSICCCICSPSQNLVAPHPFVVSYACLQSHWQSITYFVVSGQLVVSLDLQSQLVVYQQFLWCLINSGQSQILQCPMISWSVWFVVCQSSHDLQSHL